MKLCIVYGLCSTGDGIVRYVGQTTKSLESRYACHLNDARARTVQTNVTAWIKSVWASGQGVRAVVLDGNAEWNEGERRAVAEYRAKGHALVNKQAGGSYGGDDPQLVGQIIGYRQHVRHYRHVRHRKPGVKPAA